MFCIVIPPFWLTITSFIFFCLGVAVLLLSERGSEDIEYPDKDGLFTGHLAEFVAERDRQNKHVSRITAAGFFITSLFFFIESISSNQALTNALFIIETLVVLIVVSVIIIHLLRSYKKKRIRYYLVIEKPAYAAVNVDKELVLLDAANFTVKSRLKKSRVKLGEKAVIKIVVGELIVSKMSVVPAVNERGQPIRAPVRSDKGINLLEQMYKSKLKGKSRDIKLEGRFEDRDTGRRTWWQLYNLKLTSFEKSSRTFSFSASAKLVA